MPFNPQATYEGGQYLFRGISSAGQNIGDALKQYEEDKARVGMADTVVDFAKNHPGAISAEALKRYGQANAKEKAYIAMGAQSNLADMIKQGAYRKDIAEANLYTAHAAALGNPPGPAVTSVPDPNNPGQNLTIVHGGTVVGGHKGTPGQIVYHPDTKKAIGMYDANGDLKFFPTGGGMDVMSLFGVGPNQATAPPTTGAPDAATGPQAGDVAMPTYGNPANLPPEYYQQPPGQQPAAAATTTTRAPTRGGAPQAGERRYIQGQLAEWDGTGWRAVQG